jgi:hypothetical protein
VARDRKAVLDVFETVFDHRGFTGRSGTMYGYEGLGCVYWHMVAKLLLAVQENALRAIREGQPAELVEQLVQAYYRIRAGLGFEKSVSEYGAFPTDPYSHTPPQGGAKQPGMTGQVKEEILTRFGELGVQVEGGMVRFRPVLLRRAEFLQETTPYDFVGIAGDRRRLEVPAGALAFSFCQVPIIYNSRPAGASIHVHRDQGKSLRLDGDQLDAATSQALLARTGGITRIDVDVPEGVLWSP